MKTLIPAVLALSVILCMARDVPADPAGASNKLVVAVLNFESGAKEQAAQAAAVPDLLAARLGAQKDVQVVKIKKSVQDLGGDDAAVKAGKDAGARFVVSGRVYIVGKELWITAKIVNTDNNKATAKVAKGPTDTKIEDLAAKLSQEILTSMK